MRYIWKAILKEAKFYVIICLLYFKVSSRGWRNPGSRVVWSFLSMSTGVDSKFWYKFREWREFFLHKLKIDKKQNHELAKCYPGFSEDLYKIIFKKVVVCELWIHAENERGQIIGQFSCYLLTLTAILKVQLCKCYSFLADSLRFQNNILIILHFKWLRVC